MPIVAPYPSSIIITVPIEVPIVPLEVKCQIRLFLCRARLPRTSWNGHCVHKSLSFLWLFWSVFKARARVVTMQILLSVRELTLATPSCGNNRREWGLLAKPLRASITIIIAIVAFCQFSEVESFFLWHLNTIKTSCNVCHRHFHWTLDRQNIEAKSRHLTQIGDARRLSRLAVDGTQHSMRA